MEKEWGVFRLRGLFGRKVKARPLQAGSWAVTNLITTDKLLQGAARNVTHTCLTQVVLSSDDFDKYYLPVDATAKAMV